jgi:hypothetical protein
VPKGKTTARKGPAKLARATEKESNGRLTVKEEESPLSAPAPSEVPPPPPPPPTPSLGFRYPKNIVFFTFVWQTYHILFIISIPE